MTYDYNFAVTTKDGDDRQCFTCAVTVTAQDRSEAETLARQAVAYPGRPCWFRLHTVTPAR